MMHFVHFLYLKLNQFLICSFIVMKPGGFEPVSWDGLITRVVYRIQLTLSCSNGLVRWVGSFTGGLFSYRVFGFFGVFRSIARNKLLFEEQAIDWSCNYNFTFYHLARWIKGSTLNFTYTKKNDLMRCSNKSRFESNNNDSKQFFLH